MASYLISGIAGFIGSQLALSLLADGHLVTGIDNFENSYDVKLKQWRLEKISDKPSFTFHKIDVRNTTALRSIFNKEFDGVINLAAKVGVRASIEDPRGYYETNLFGTLNLLDFCNEFSINKFVLASTSSVYGEDTKKPFEEFSPATKPLSPYAASKRSAELLAFNYSYLYDIDTTILRYFTVYGPAGRPDMAIYRFVRGIVENEPITIYGDGSQERDFTHVHDVVRGTVAALKPSGFSVINLGGDRPVSLTKIISYIERSSGEKALIEHTDRHPTDVEVTAADIRRAGQILGWRPRISLEDGIKETVDWYMLNRHWAKHIY